ncbi:VOC family protein [Massilia sp. 9I]|uniref:VOC family protein n=1 Tax=Massilia sp. 9I TaxID=2653152 RepID=UPI0012F18ABA|nr:VOC family protein [Massilia sp. 9I]VXC07672.1 Drug:proton antiporter [Massilia sp. 9I]
MLNPSYSLLYVAAPEASARLYAALLDAQPVEVSPTFALFALGGGRMLGLWSRDSAVPASDFHGSSSELGFRVESRAEVDALHARWRGQGVDILQAPARVDFGYTFTVADPDGHRLRVFAREE